MPKVLKIILVILGVVLIIGVGLVLLNVIPLSSPKITEAAICKNINRDTAEPIDVTSEFKSNIPAIYCAIKASKIRGGSVIKAEWYFGDGKLTENNLTVPGEKFLYSNRSLYFELKKPEGADWDVGDYKVKVYLDNQLNQTVSFKIKAENGQTSEAQIASATTCKKVDENFAPVDPQSKFSADTDKIYCSVNISNAQKNAVIRSSWWNKDKNEMLPNSDSSYKVSKDHSAGYVAFSYSTEGQKWDKGSYEVKIYVGNKLVKEVPFTIE
jgi:hypothetical protein